MGRRDARRGGKLDLCWHALDIERDRRDGVRRRNGDLWRGSGEVWRRRADEIKRQREIGREVIDEMAAKIDGIRRQRGMSVKTALVYDGHLAPIVEADGYFDAIVPFRHLLGI